MGFLSWWAGASPSDSTIMANKQNQEPFAYDFERPILDIEKEIRELAERAGSDGEDLSGRI